MKNRVTILITALMLLSICSSCSKIESKNTYSAASDETVSETVTGTESTTDADTSVTEASSENEAPSAVTEDAEASSAKAGTYVTEKVTKAVTTVITTAKKIVTTTGAAAKSTTGATTKAATTSGSTQTTNKYGVAVLKSSDGSVAVVRTMYTGTYSELLPAAQKNRSTYSDYINQVLALTNAMRAEQGIAPLTLSSKLTEQACVRAEEIAWSGKHSHRRPDGTYFSELFKINGYTTGLTGENIGWGYSTPSAVCQAWKESEGHYANIMNPDFVCIGLGVAADPDPDGKLIWVQHFYSKVV